MSDRYLDELVKKSVNEFFDSLQGDKLPEWPYIITSGGCEKKIQPWYWTKLRETLPPNLYAMPEVNIRNKMTPDFVVYEKEVPVHEGYKASIEFKFNYINQEGEFKRLYDAFSQQRFPDDSRYGNHNLYVIYLLAGLFDRGNSSLIVEGQYQKFVTQKFDRRKKEIIPIERMKKASGVLKEISNEAKCKKQYSPIVLDEHTNVVEKRIGDTSFDVGVAVLLFKQCVLPHTAVNISSNSQE